MNIGRKILFSTLLMAASAMVFAKGPDNVQKDPKGGSNNLSPVAGCTPANRIVYLEFNNVRTRVETGGLWWQDRPNSVADYEVPKGSNSFAIYAGGLWMAGTDVNGQLKAAASLFGNGGVDYWTGPLDITGTAEINEEVCGEYDKFFEISRQDVAEFVLYNNVKNDPVKFAAAFPDDYSIPTSITDWPGNGRTESPYNQAPILAPFVDIADDGFYDPDDGDYPFYDLDGSIDCRAPRTSRSQSSSRPLFGDQTFWWIFNDKGNLHTETNAPSIGMEIHAQAFAFATNDQINDMTFYNFELINRSTFTLTDTYFASYVDSDLGNSADDYVGCDVGRGFGYCYNGDEFDESVRGQTGYGANPAAIGIDFFEGPYQDADGIDNLVGIGPGQALNGLGYSDSIADNERYGMRRFVYYNIGGGQNGDPSLAIHYYNYMRGIWQNGQPMRHGGNGLNTSGVESAPTAFMFPGESDPLGWGVTDPITGITAARTNLNWTEDEPGGGQEANAPGDRRFLQSAGPFTLEPGNVNDITVGVVFAQAESGGRLASVKQLITADDKAQALFGNCFQVLSGPDAPDLTIQELDQELIVYISNGALSNNTNEDYEEEDPNIITPDTIRQILGRDYDNKYRFQGYQVFQVKSNDISVSQINNPDVARLVFQCDIADNVTTLTNYTFDEGIQANFPETKVNGVNEGISHSFRVTDDLFASGESRLVNYKTYYYIAVAYAYNNFKTYQQDASPDLNNVLAPAFDGQKMPYLASRKNSSGGSIESVAAIPHNYRAEEGGTIKNSNYGDLLGITRLQGTGNGNNAIRLTTTTVDQLMAAKAWEDEDENPIVLDYALGAGPLTVKVVDPLNVIDGRFVFKFLDEDVAGEPNMSDTAEWVMYLEGGGPFDTVYSDRTIATRNEQLLFSPNWGLSILVEQAPVPGINSNGVPIGPTNGYLGSSITFSDPTRTWLTGIPDVDNQTPQDWILSGVTGGVSAAYGDRVDQSANFIDPNQDYESIISGTLAPYSLVGYGIGNPNTGTLVNKPGFDLSSENNSKIEYLNSLVLVYTSDKSKWTRCPVVEMQEDPDRAIANDNKYRVRRLGSIDKEGNQWQPGMPTDVTDPNSASYIDSMGMGWFPGYALNAETGERYNMAYGEDSWYGVDNGADMIFNPTSTFASGVPGATNLVWGGKHSVYVFRKSGDNEGLPSIAGFDFRVNDYDGGKRLVKMMRSNFERSFAWRACSWVTLPMLIPGQQLLATDVRIDVNVSKPFDVKFTDLITERDTIVIGTDTTFINDGLYHNDGRPVYTFATRGFAARKNETATLKDELKRVNIVPNPYYAISSYETSAVDNRVKITNLPSVANIKIYNMSGTLVRSYKKSDPTNFLDWDLKNEVGIPISSGVYIIHVDVPNVGEKIIKWFGVMRPVDLNNF